METLSRYHLVERVGATAAAERFRAYEVTSGGLVRPVLLARARPGDPSCVQRLLDESRLLSVMSHPHVVRLVDVGHEAGQYFLVTEWLEGRSLATVLDRARDRKLTFDPKPALYITMMVLEALAHVHERTDSDGVLMSVVHTGVCPGAVQLGYQGEVALSEFGQARAQAFGHREAARTEEGSLRYASPEQALGMEVDHRADLFSAGLLLYELLAGHPAYTDRAPEQVRSRAERAAVIPIREVARHVAPELALVLDRALAFDKNRRFGSAHAFRDALAPILYGADPTFGAHKLASFVSMLLPEEAEDDRRRDHEARALLTTGGASALDGPSLSPRLPAGSEAQTLGQGLEVSTPAPVPKVSSPSPKVQAPKPATPSPVAKTSEPPRKSSLGGLAHANTAELVPGQPEAIFDAGPPAPRPAEALPASLGVSPSPSDLAARHAPTSVPPPSLDHRPWPWGRIVGGLLAASLLGLLVFTFSSSQNQRLVSRKLRQAIVGRKAGATLTMESIPPGATLFLDDEDTGRTTPVTIENVESELVHQVRLELSGEPAVTATVALVAGSKRTLSLTFPNSIVNLSVKSVPEASELWMDGRQVALTPATLTLRVGQPTKLQVKRVGYVDWAQDLTPARGEDTELELVLEKTPDLLAAEAAEKQALDAAKAEEEAAKAPPKKRRRRRR